MKTILLFLLLACPAGACDTTFFEVGTIHPVRLPTDSNWSYPDTGGEE